MTDPATEPPRHTLKEVIAIIPESCYRNSARKALPYLIRAVLLYGVFLVALVSTDQPILLLPLWLLAGLSVSGLFVLGHDACHGALFPSRKSCRRWGRFLMLPALHIYSAWEMGHNRIHHSLTVKQQKDFVWHPLSAQKYQGLSRWQKLVHRLEWSVLGAGLYYLIEIWWKKMAVLRPANKLARAIEEDRRFVGYFLLGSVVLALGGGQLLGVAPLYSLWVWAKLIVVPWLIFSYIIGATVYIHHIHPDIPWHDDSMWSKFKGQVEGTTNIRMPALLNMFFHNIFIHIPHHVDPRIPFYHLPAAAEAIKQSYRDLVHERSFKMWDYVRTTRRCKLYDFDANSWLNYRGQVQRGWDLA
ncbi:MAG: fatty acid desaturase [Candidatus Latescibacteria bacterium]|nr:fatty acid desaturase [Candidatus Latescibacterota bacterium]